MIFEDLAKLESQHKPIRLGVSGAGWMGSGYVKAFSHVQGMRVNLIADPDISLAKKAFTESGIAADQIVAANTPQQAMDALNRGKKVVTERYDLAAQLEAIDIVSDATPYPASGAETAYSCIQYHKDVVMVNIEADVTVGRISKEISARRRYPIYGFLRRRTGVFNGIMGFCYHLGLYPHCDRERKK